VKLKFKNKTDEPQQINLVDNSAINVSGSQETIIDSWNIYKEELERVKKFFDVSHEEIEPPKIIVEKEVDYNIFQGNTEKSILGNQFSDEDINEETEE